ncbi:MAG: hypothetical protein AB2L09_03260 [Coriobacteriia bacterium]
MTTEQLAERLKCENVPRNYYSLDGGLPLERWCLNNDAGVFEVYYSERGKKEWIAVFADEDDACEYLYQRIINTMRHMKGHT